MLNIIQEDIDHNVLDILKLFSNLKKNNIEDIIKNLLKLDRFFIHIKFMILLLTEMILVMAYGKVFMVIIRKV